MKAPVDPPDEAARLAALQAYNILDTSPEPAFDALTQLAAHVVGVPIALVSFVDTDRQWFKSRYGLEVPELPRDVSFCGHAVADHAMLVVEDAALDDRFHDNPLVVGEPRVRFYAGMPLETPDGYVLGTLCTIGDTPQTLSAEQLEMLQLLAQQVVDQLERRRHNVALTQSRTELQSYQQFFQLSHDLFATVDSDLRLQRLNPAWQVTLGWTGTQLQGRSLLELVHPDDVAATVAEAGRLVREGTPTVHFEHRFRHADGRWIPLAWVARIAGGVFHASARDMSVLYAKRDERLRVEAELREFKDTLDRTVDAIFMFDPDDLRISYANQGTTRQLGYTRDELGQMSALDLVAPDHQDTYRRQLATARGGSQHGVVSLETTYRTHDGSALAVEVVLQFVAARDGARARFISVVRDISERKRVERLQSEFVSTVSHELRTPLTSIRGALGLVANGVTGELGAETQEYVDIALGNSERLVRLINDILDIEKMQSGKIEFRMRAVSVASAIETAMRANAAIAEAGKVTLHLVSEIPAGEIVVDPDRLNQVLTNLISNAVKFSPPGVTVDLRVARRGSMVRIAVRDHGAGVPAEFRDRMFQRFAQADTSSTRQKGGTGLGLSISKSIVEKLGGTIGLADPDGGGAELYFELPFLEPAAPAGAGRRILICEADPGVYRLIERTLTGVGFAVDLAPTVERARRLLATIRYDAITLDLVLADGEAISLLEDLEADHGRAPPVIVVSSSDRELGRSVQLVSAVINKPFDEARLREAIQAAVGRTDASRPRVLHVDDDPHIRKIVKRLLPGAWTVLGAVGVSDAREILAEQAFDVVVLDLALPDGNGDELVPLVGGAQIIIFSAVEAHRELVRQVSSVLVKTQANAQDLRDVIMSLVGRAKVRVST